MDLNSNALGESGTASTYYSYFCIVRSTKLGGLAVAEFGKKFLSSIGQLVRDFVEINKFLDR